MKRTLLLAGFALLSNILFAQNVALQDTVWRIDGKFGLKFNQVALTNWAAGGENSLAGNVSYDMTANYRKGKWRWNNAIILGYGLSKQGEDPTNKTDDQILLNSTLGYKLGDSRWFATLNGNFRTQFSNGYNLPNDSVKVSAFMAPGYLVAGIGIKYTKTDEFKLLVTPITNKTVFVLDDFLSAQGAYGVDSMATVRAEFGAFVSLLFKKEVLNNVTINTLFTMFGNYEDLGVWDINWDMLIDFKINEWLAANITTNLIYDQDVKIPVDRTGDGIKESYGPRVQFRQAFGLGLVAKFKKFR